MKHHLCRSWIEKIDGCKTNPENVSSTKVDKHIPSDFSMSTISLFKSIANKCDVYKGKDCLNAWLHDLGILKRTRNRNN